ncbi:MAG TPA: hypothetical protein VH916_03865 [Dehalococcoidia bacterium]
MAEAREDTFWDLLAEVARLQERMGKDTVAWARVYETAGKALQQNAETAALMAELGRRSEQFMRTGPSVAARQAMQFFLNPLQAFGAAGAGAPMTPGPLTRFWEAWLSERGAGGGETD